MKPIMAIATLVVATLVMTAPAAADEETWTVRTGMSQGRLGAQIMDMTEDLRQFYGAPKDAGLLVSKVLKDSPAARAGMRVGDVIVEVDGKPVSRSWDVLSVLSDKHKGDKVAVSVIRNERSVKLTATIESEGMPMGMDMEGWRDFGPHGEGGGHGPGMMEEMHRWMPLWQGVDRDMDKALDELRQRMSELEKRLGELEKGR